MGLLAVEGWHLSLSLGHVGNLQGCDVAAKEGQQSYFFLMSDAATSPALVGVDDAGHTYT